MKKQVIFGRFIPRAFSIAFDMFIISMTISKLIGVYYNILFYWTFIDIMPDTETVSMLDSARHASISREFLEKFSELDNGFRRLIFLQFAAFIPMITLMGGYFVFFWYRFGSTPGSFLLGIKIVSQDNYDQPASIKNLTKRFIGLLFGFIGIWFMFFDDRKRALHDRWAKTVVIKR